MARKRSSKLGGIGSQSGQGMGKKRRNPTTTSPRLGESRKRIHFVFKLSSRSLCHSPLRESGPCPVFLNHPYLLLSLLAIRIIFVPLPFKHLANTTFLSDSFSCFLSKILLWRRENLCKFLLQSTSSSSNVLFADHETPPCALPRSPIKHLWKPTLLA